MEHPEIFHYIKTSLIRGHVFFGVAIFGFLILIILTALYGTIRTYKMDPDNPNIMKGEKHDMHIDTFAKYYFIMKTVGAITFFSSLIGVILYGYWKKWSFL
jgi:hypothetical protein